MVKNRKKILPKIETSVITFIARCESSSRSTLENIYLGILDSSIKVQDLDNLYQKENLKLNTKIYLGNTLLHVTSITKNNVMSEYRKNNYYSLEPLFCNLPLKHK